MTRSGYLGLLALLLAASLSGVLFTLWFQWEQGTPTELSCTEWEDRLLAGRFRLTDCELAPEPSSSESMLGHDLGVVWVGMHEHPWTTSRPDLVRATGYSASAHRAHQRVMALFDDEVHDIEVEAVVEPDGSMALYDLRKMRISIWVGVVPFLVFGLPILLLIRKQRRWRETRLAWERSKGVLTGGDEPTAF